MNELLSSIKEGSCLNMLSDSDSGLPMKDEYHVRHSQLNDCKNLKASKG